MYNLNRYTNIYAVGEKRNDKKRPGKAMKPAIVNKGAGQHDETSDAPPNQLTLKEGSSDDARFHSDPAGRIKIHSSNGKQKQRCSDETPVQIGKKAFIEDCHVRLLSQRLFCSVWPGEDAA